MTDNKKSLIKTNLKIPKGVIRTRNSRKDKQHNVQKKTDKRTNSDLQPTTQKIKGRARQTALKIEVNSCASKGLVVPAPLVTHVVLLLLQTR